MRKLSALTLTTTAIFVISCKKGGDNPPENNIKCASLSAIKATASNTTIEKGQHISFQSPTVQGVTYRWQTPGGMVFGTDDGELYNVDFNNEGWFYLEATNNCNEVKKDSFYLDVTMQQGSAPCSPANNSINFTAGDHPASSFITVSHGETGIPNDAYRLHASGGGNDLTIAFHPSYKNNKQPENGVYTTSPFVSNWNIAFLANDYDKVFITNVTHSPTTITYKSNPYQKLYVTRINGKLKVSVCNMTFTDSSKGAPYVTDITFAAVEN
jgi:hypothetical protein